MNVKLNYLPVRVYLFLSVSLDLERISHIIWIYSTAINSKNTCFIKVLKEIIQKLRPRKSDNYRHQNYVEKKKTNKKHQHQNYSHLIVGESNLYILLEPAGIPVPVSIN